MGNEINRLLAHARELRCGEIRGEMAKLRHQRHELEVRENALMHELWKLDAICPNCDSPMPEGCERRFLDDGKACRLNSQTG